MGVVSTPRPASRSAAGKPEKPSPDFPLFAHPSGQWAKKIKRKLEYFGSWRNDREGVAALEVFNREWYWLSQGKTPPPIDVTSDSCTLRQLVNDFLETKEAKVDAGELSPRTFRDYYKSCEAILAEFGKERRVSDLRPDDFRTYRAKLAKRYGVISLKNEINRVCILFNYAHENNLIEKPVSYGQNFDRPSAKALRKEKNEAGAKLFEREEIIRILDELKDDAQLTAMVLLGLNCGFGNTDCSSLPRSALDLESGWIEFPRPKTEISRRIPLWPETIAALKTVHAKRPAPAVDADHRLVFLTRHGRPWVRTKFRNPKEAKPGEEPEKIGLKDTVPIDSISREFGKVLKKLHINGRRGLGLYTCRHMTETFGGESKDQVAVDAILGHVDSSMGANYRHRISDERLRAVVDTVRAWLYPSPEKEGGAA